MVSPMIGPTTEILLRIEAYCRATGLSVSRFGEQAVGDRTLVRRLRNGRSITLHTLAKIETFMRPRSRTSTAKSV